VSVPKPPCPHCDEDFAQALNPEHIRAIAAQTPIPAALQAEGRAFEARLAVCENCEALREKVLCAYCGCFVLFRARVRQSGCPHPSGNKWLQSYGK
jgi:hypothetical protein